MTKETLNQYLDLYPELIELFGKIIDIKNGQSSKQDICKGLLQMSDDAINKIDSAYPVDYAKSIREIYPDFNNGYYVYDYNTNRFGELRNLKNDIANEILKPL